MAETVKKSRIVSDDEENLEEALLEEFNMRLKNCMSKDDLHNTDEQIEDDDNAIYENVTSSPKAASSVSAASQNLSPNSTASHNLPLHSMASYDFIENERLHHQNAYSPLINGSEDKKDVEADLENIYETLPEHQQQKTEEDQYVDMSLPSNQQHSLSLDVSPEIKVEQIGYDQVKDNSVVENSYEVVEQEDMEKPRFSLSATDPYPTNIPDDNMKSSVKDRMFLATDDAAATLLFTQTVTSPMLTPSEENIDFLKGFQRDIPNSNTTSSSDSPPKNLEKTSEENSTSESVAEPLPAVENVYDNDDIVKQSPVKKNPENIYENLKDPRAHENIYENVLETKKETEDLEDIEEHIYQDIEDCHKENAYEEVDETSKRPTNTDDVMIENSLYNKLDDLETKNLIIDLEDDENNKDTEKIYETINTVKETTSHIEHYDEITSHVEKTETYSEIEDSKSAITNSYVKPSDIQLKTKESYSQKENDSQKETSNTSVLELDRKESNKITESNEQITKESYSELIYHSKTESNYYEKYTEVVAKNSKNVEISNREKDTETVPPEIVKNLKNQFSKGSSEVATTPKKEVEVGELRKINIMKQINKFELNTEDGINSGDSTVTECYTETTTIQTDVPGDKGLKKKKTKKSRKEEKENISVNDLVNGESVYNVSVKHLKSSFSKFDALQKKNVLHVRSSDSERAQEKFNDSQQIDSNNCKACLKQVFQMEQVKAEKAVWHRNCFRCTECSKQLTVETYASHEGNLYCKPHFKSLFVPKAVEDDATPRPRKPELIIRENQPVELPPDVVRASDKPDLGLEDLQNLNVKERFQVFEHHQSYDSQETERGPTPVNVKKSPSILSKLARFQAKGMDVGVTDDALNGIPIEESTSEEEEEEDVPDGEDPTLYKAKRVQKEKPFHFTNLSEVKNKWEQGEHTSKDQRREERKQEIQSIRDKLFMGKQGKMKEAYQQAIIQSESCANLHKSEKIESCDTKSLKERFEKGEPFQEKEDQREDEETEVYQSEISKKSRSLFLQLDANASKPPQISPVVPQKLDVKKAREAYLAKTASEDTVKSSEVMEDIVEVKTADIQQRFKFFETYKEPEQQRKQFRITPPRDPSQVKSGTPEREIYHDPDVVRSEDYVDDSVIAKTTHTASKMLNKFRQMEENLQKEPESVGPKPLKRFTPPPEPARHETSSEEESGTEEEESEGEDQADNQKVPQDLIEAQKAARAKQLRAKFEKWEAEEIKREQNQSVNIIEEYGDESQVESTRSLRARFEQLRDSDKSRTPTRVVKVNRFVELPSIMDVCQGCEQKVYPLEKISVHGYIYHKNCFKCKECSCVLRMDTYSYNQGLLYCTPHFKRLFISKGNYDSAFGLRQPKQKWNMNATMA